MRAWESLEVGDRVCFRWDEFDGKGTLNCYISSIHKDHAIAMDYDANRYWIDDDTKHMFQKGWM